MSRCSVKSGGGARTKHTPKADLTYHGMIFSTSILFAAAPVTICYVPSMAVLYHRPNERWITLLIDLVKEELKRKLGVITHMVELKTLSYKKWRQLSCETGYDCIELDDVGRTVLVQYYVCSSNIPCVRVLGYIQEHSALRASSEQEFLIESHLPPGLEPIPEEHKWFIRRCVMVDTAARFSIDVPLVHFG